MIDGGRFVLRSDSERCMVTAAEQGVHSKIAAAVLGAKSISSPTGRAQLNCRPPRAALN